MATAVIGGTGALGRGVATRFASIGEAVVIGSRDAARAAAAAAELNALVGRDVVSGAANAEAATAGEVVFVCVPFAAQDDTLQSIREAVAGKVVVETTVPLVPGRPTELQAVAEGSAAQRAQALLGSEARVVAGLHHLSAGLLAEPHATIDSDVLICGDDATARAAAIELIGRLGWRVFDAGPLRMAQTLERFTPLLIGLNRRLKRQHLGLRLTGV
jgi:8-hydroxy-5-deazaflavin:NADPH oxidoreductase